jgi:hypothetical protein
VPSWLLFRPGVPGFFHEGEDRLIVALSCPDCSEKIRGMEAVFPKKMAVSAAAIHDVMAERAFEKTTRLFDDSRQPGDAIERRTLWRQFVRANFCRITDALLFEEKVIAASRGDKEVGVPIGFAGIYEILRVVIDVDRPQPDGGKEALLIAGKIGCVVPIACSIQGNGFIVEGAKPFRPSIQFHEPSLTKHVACCFEVNFGRAFL